MSRKAITKKLKRAQKLAEQAKNMADRQRLGREKKFRLPGQADKAEVVETGAEETRVEENPVGVAEVEQIHANIKSPVTEENMPENTAAEKEIVEAAGITIVDGSVPFVKESLAGVHHKKDPGASVIQGTPVVSVVDRTVEAKGKVSGNYRVGPNWYCITKGQTLFIPPSVKAHFREHGLVE